MAQEELDKQYTYTCEAQCSDDALRAANLLESVRNYVTKGTELRAEECECIAYLCGTRRSFRDALLTMCIAKCDEREVGLHDVLTMAFLPHSEEAKKKTGDVLSYHMDYDHEDNAQLRALGEMFRHISQMENIPDRHRAQMFASYAYACWWNAQAAEALRAAGEAQTLDESCSLAHIVTKAVICGVMRTVD